MHTDPLTDVRALAREFEGAAPSTLLDVRWRLAGPPGIEDYREGHVPGAVHVDLDRDVCGKPGPLGRHPLPDAGEFQAAMRAAGVSRGRAVVVYDHGDALAAARTWWTLRHFGHPDVRVLDGGYRAWCAAGYATTTVEPEVVPGDFVVQPGAMPSVDAAGAAGIAAEGTLLDVRAPERFRGETEPMDPVAGHIPGAVNAPASGNLDQDGRFLAPDRLRERLVVLGPGTGDRVGVYCGSGVTAAQGVLALHLAGIPAELYVGSWSNWVADRARPVATGG